MPPTSPESDPGPDRALPKCPPGMEDFYALRIRGVWRAFRRENLSFWMICGYLFTEYVRPQSIIPALDVLPWAQLFIGLSIVASFFDKTIKRVKNPITLLMLLFFVSIILSTITATYPSVSVERLPDFYNWLIIYLLIVHIVNTRKRFFIFVMIFLVASFKISASLALAWAQRGFAFANWGLQGPPGFFQNSGELAIQMVIFAPIAYAVTISIAGSLNKFKLYAMWAMPFSAVLVILGASSRGGQLAMAVQFLFKFGTRLFRLRNLIVILLVAFMSWSLLPDQQKARFESMGEDVTSKQRIIYWERGLEMLSDHPLLGVGYYNFIPYFSANYSSDLLVPRPELPHNIFVQVAADLGYLGLGVYILIIASAIFQGRRLQRGAIGKDAAAPTFDQQFGAALNLSLIGFLVAGQFVSVVYYPFMWINLALLVSLINVVEAKKDW